MRVLVFGDSITYGAWDSQGGWADRLKRAFHEQRIHLDTQDGNYHQLINLGIGGDTSTDLLARIESETKARASASWPFVFVLAIGVNDSRLINGGGEAQTPEVQFAENLRKIITLCQKYSSKILLIGLTPVATERVVFKDLIYTNERIKQYDKIVSEAAIEFGLPKVELSEPFNQQNVQSLLGPDGLHPNDAGHELIAKIVLPELAKRIPS